MFCKNEKLDDSESQTEDSEKLRRKLKKEIHTLKQENEETQDSVEALETKNLSNLAERRYFFPQVMYPKMTLVSIQLLQTNFAFGFSLRSLILLKKSGFI